ncbi:hypothetical protein SKAU_G00255150 [Synaphobranchus kaupii]|uniref:Uncharacterized protein n=1 Tax=Synaphobranchus kaupii TaxID=118154 RepID=A0A9Q1F3L9_SYNKA|nr:hypothetical protein SKAU_G00255150 [Synaphobranchus kaupii]
MLIRFSEQVSQGRTDLRACDSQLSLHSCAEASFDRTAVMLTKRTGSHYSKDESSSRLPLSCYLYNPGRAGC